MKAPDFLRKAADLLETRAKEYDKQGGERSIPSAVTAFNAITGKTLSPQEGWLFMHLVKKVRLHTNKKAFHQDSAEDSIAYDALEAEEFFNRYNSHTPPPQSPPAVGSTPILEPTEIL